MLPILILNNEKIHSQVYVTATIPSDNAWSLSLNNITRNTYKIFLEIYFINDGGEIIFKSASGEFYLSPGITTLTEKEIGSIISVYTFSEAVIISVCVRQKYGPDLGFQQINCN